MDLRDCILLFVSITCVCSLNPPTLHLDLTPEERVHYFGQDLLEDVPQYEYTTPQRIDRRRRRETGSSDGDQLEYVMRAFGEVHHLLLDKNKNLISPGCLVQRFKGNGSREVAPCSTAEVDCFYTGSVSNNTDSWVSASVCGGMHGVIGIGGNALVIQPIREQHMSRAKRDTSLENPHIVYQYRNKRSCSSHGARASDDGVTSRRRRRRRSATKRYIDSAVVADKSVYEFHGEETEKIIKAIMNVVAHRLLDSTIGTQLYLSINKIVILEQDVDNLRVVTNSATTLTNLCEWQTSWNPADDADPEHADYVLLLTKTDLAFNGNRANSGLARMGVCGRTGGCSVNEDAGLGAGLTIAHETGHVLGMEHDGDGNSCPNGVNIMSSMSPSGPQAFKWSTCSAEALNTFLSTQGSACLNDAPPGSALKPYDVTTKPGSLYTANQQCKQMIGPEAEVCEGVHANGQDVCGGLVCRPKPDTGVNGCVIYGMPRMDGTDCGNETLKRAWCNQGSCVAMGPGTPPARDGGWSDWDHSFHECSRSCGGGVKIKQRFCNNPEPMYGGKPCEGPNVVGEICNVQPCSKTQMDFLAEQCAATDDRPIQGRTYHWVPNTGASGDDSCKVNCNAEGTNWISKRGLNVDGSSCLQHDTPAAFSKCVAGSCKVFGCDGHMNSGLAYDQCGLCNGKGDTCRKVSGTFREGKAREFTTFVTIPAGATGITITQGNIFCFLSVVVKGERLFTETAPRLSGAYTRGGVAMKYLSKPERLEIVGPTAEPIQAQVYRKYGPPYVGVDPEVYYEYHMSVTTQESNYMWKTKTGTCSKSCGTGTQLPTITCEGPAGTVEDYFCNINDKPAEFRQECNTHACPPRWRTSEWSECSVTCGGGRMTRKAECVQENRDVETVVGDAMCAGKAQPTTTALCSTAHCPGVWKAEKWTACSVTCARGTRSRPVKCYDTAALTTPIDDDRCLADEKPADTEYCMEKPCRMDISGDACADKQANCFQSYGDDVCTGLYKTWAHANCMKSCGVCVEDLSEYDPNCKDVKENCAVYTAGFCTDDRYAGWAKKNCMKFCGYCETGTTTTTTQAPVDPNCMDSVNCPQYGESVCTQYAGWSQTHCPKFCNLCQKEETKAACDDVKSNCAAYGSKMCTEYRGWALNNCRGFCGLCDARKKRSAGAMAPPPLDLVKVVPTTQVHREEPILKELVDLPVTLPNVDVDNAIEDADGKVLMLIPDDEEGEHVEGPAPETPVCNTVKTEMRGTIDVIGELSPGVPCEQTIVLPLGNRVLLNFDAVNVDCKAGDVFLIIDGITNEEIPVCNSPLQNEWLSSGSIVSLEFMAGTEDHGYRFTYEAYPGNGTVPECSEELTATRGEVLAVPFPRLQDEPDETCEIYITATPGLSVRLTFSTFHLARTKTTCDADHSLVIQDLVGGEEDMFCGELSPFIWESNGARVRLRYRQSSLVEGFSASYNIIEQ